MVAYAGMGNILLDMGECYKAMLNFRKAAMCGMEDKSVFDILREGYRDGFITKAEYAFTLRENQAACNEMKSEARERFRVQYLKRNHRH